jgi:hypothetical protein
MQANSHCPFCRLICAAGGLQRYSGDYAVSAKWKPKQGFYTTGPAATSAVFLNEETAVSPYGSARFIHPQIDPGLIKKWLRLCEYHHELTCTPKPEIIETPKNQSGLKVLRVIDTQEQCIVEAAPGCRYIALSYLWGQVSTVRLLRSNKMQLTTKGGLIGFRRDLPKTISDAIDLVSAVGERYLWVDSLCLLQDDAADMRDGISKMDLVYQGSILTIVAACGVDANAGLPGLHPGSRKVSQLVEEVKPGIKMTITNAMYDLLGSSRHSTRGWT